MATRKNAVWEKPQMSAALMRSSSLSKWLRDKRRKSALSRMMQYCCWISRWNCSLRSWFSRIFPSTSLNPARMLGASGRPLPGKAVFAICSNGPYKLRAMRTESQTPMRVHRARERK